MTETVQEVAGVESDTDVTQQIEAKDAVPFKASDLLTTSAAQLALSIEALLLSVDRPVTGARIAEALGLVHDAEDAIGAERDAARASDVLRSVDKERGGGEVAASQAPEPKKKKKKLDRAQTPLGMVEGAIELLNAEYEKSKRSFRVEAVAGGYRVMTLPRFAPVLEAYHGKRERHGVSRAALETLAIIAYKQPMTRAGLENIRGVACGEVLRSLIERRLVTIVGRAEELGRPMLYGTTKAFLETFGLSSVKDLPSVEEFRKNAEGE